VTEFKTPGGKGIEIYTCPVTAHQKIKLTSGGILPEELSGVFTSIALAQIAITTYLFRNADTQVRKEVKKQENLTPKEKYYAKQEAKEAKKKED
jgi:hypothetical protein